MHQLDQFTIDLLVQQDCPQHLDAAAGGARAGDKTRQKQHPEGREIRPYVVVGGGKPERSGDGNGVECCVTQGFREIEIKILVQQEKRQPQNADAEYRKIPADFGIEPISQQAAHAKRHEVRGKADAGNQGKQHDNRLKQRRVEVGHAGIVRRHAAERHYTKTMNHGVDPAHASRP